MCEMYSFHILYHTVYSYVLYYYYYYYYFELQIAFYW
jgi:hypothetical protein